MIWVNYYKYSKTEYYVSICSEFEAIKEHALKVPETTEEMMDLISYVEKARTVGIQELAERIQVRKYKFTYSK
jgi:dynein heavy chain